jgi:hypothetical protein
MIRFELVREKKKRKKDTHTRARARAGKIIPVCSAWQSIEKLKNNCDVIVLRAMPAMNVERERERGERKKKKEEEHANAILMRR